MGIWFFWGEERSFGGCMFSKSRVGKYDFVKPGGLAVAGRQIERLLKQNSALAIGIHAFSSHGLPNREMTVSGVKVPFRSSHN